MLAQTCAGRAKRDYEFPHLYLPFPFGLPIPLLLRPSLFPS